MVFDPLYYLGSCCYSSLSSSFGCQVHLGDAISRRALASNHYPFSTAIRTHIRVCRPFPAVRGLLLRPPAPSLSTPTTALAVLLPCSFRCQEYEPLRFRYA